MGRLTARAGSAPLRELLAEYGGLFSRALAVMATSRKHANVLYHLMSFLKQSLDSGDKAELVECIESYRQRRVPLVVPVTC
jgi:uncharacterized protein YbgA (DUF1722 family)